MSDHLLRAVALAQAHLPELERDERGEGVISAAIVVLIMALLGAAMWVAFNGIFTDATNRAGNEVGRIGG
ncbi:MAG: hypothetical protein AAGA99_01815 [Actinomycetota bacterium]